MSEASDPAAKLPTTCAACGDPVVTLGSEELESGIDCTECGRIFCDNCYDTSKGDGCHCHPAVKGPKFTRDQIAFIAEQILTGALDFIANCLPPTVPVIPDEWPTRTVHKAIGEAVNNLTYGAMAGAATALSILFAQATGEGMETFGWPGATEFKETCDRMIAERSAPGYSGPRPGEPHVPSAAAFAEAFAREWERYQVPMA